MPKLLIHIGMEKTGSTSVQKILSKSRKALARNSVHFPRILGKSNHNYLASAYIPMESSRLSRGLSKHNRDGRKSVVEAFKQDLLHAVSRYDNTIISGEHLFRLEPAEIKALRGDLLEIGAIDIRVIGYVRDPASLYLSFVQQELKGSSCFPSPGHFFFPYKARIQAWKAHFECEVFDFSATTARKGGLTKHFMARVEDYFGLPSRLTLHSDPVLNQSLSAEEMQILQDFRRHIFPDSDGTLNDETKRLLKALFLFRDRRWKKPVLTEDVVKCIRARHADEMRFLVQECGFEAMGFPTEQARNTFELDNYSVTDIVSNFDEDLYKELYSRLVLTLIKRPFFNLSRRLQTRWLKRKN